MYLALKNLTKKWQSIQGWRDALNCFALLWESDSRCNAANQKLNFNWAVYTNCWTHPTRPPEGPIDYAVRRQFELRRDYIRRRHSLRHFPPVSRLFDACPIRLGQVKMIAHDTEIASWPASDR